MPNLSMKKGDIIAVVMVIPICLYVFYESTQWPVAALLGRPFVIPRGVSTVLLGAILFLLYRALTGRALNLEKRLAGTTDLWRVTGATVLTFGYMFVVERIGFFVTTLLYMLLFALVLGERRWLRLVLFAIIVPLIVYVLFSTALHVPLPRGCIENSLRDCGVVIF